MPDQSAPAHVSPDHSAPTGAPWPGSHAMPQWNVAELPPAPVFNWRLIASMLGPALLMGGAAIGGGEWLLGPTVTARYGGGLMWLATLSILGQVLYNIEISRYTLYTGEPIFTGKFRTLPGPHFWLLTYIILDFGSIFPYLAASAATPIFAIVHGRMPSGAVPAEVTELRWLGMGVFVLAFVPLVFGGKVYNSLKAVMTFKIFTVLGFLLVLSLCYSKTETWIDIFSGFFKIGNVPVQRAEDLNGNGRLDPGEDWDSDGHLDVVEPALATADAKGKVADKAWTVDLDGDGVASPYPYVSIPTDKSRTCWPDLDQDGKADTTLAIVWPQDAASELRGTTATVLLDANGDGVPDRTFVDFDGDGIRDGDNLKNIFVEVFQGRGVPLVDLSMIAFLAAFASISGSGGLSNTPTSNYTRDQGWGMGHHVGAIPSIVGGQNITLSHVGTVFRVTPESLTRWKQWYYHVARDQLIVWMPACFVGIALPSMLSVEFLRRGVQAESWTAAGMTADAVRDRVADVSHSLPLGQVFWFMTLLCGFLTLAPTMASTADGVIRRWVDVFWTSSRTLRSMDPGAIRYVYFSVLVGYLIFGLLMLGVFPKPDRLVTIATNIFNFALGFSCWHTLALNTLLLPKELRPGWFVRIGMFLAGLFFWVLATLTFLRSFGWI